MSSRKGMGGVYRPSYSYGGEKKQSSVYWCFYSIGGQKTRESTGTTKHQEAIRFLHCRLAERGQGISRRDLEKVKFADLVSRIEANYRQNGRRSLDRMLASAAHLTSCFNGWRVVDITEPAIDSYIEKRLAAKAAPGTVNYELAILRRMFRLGQKAQMVGRAPEIDMLKLDNVRKGFLLDGELEAILDLLPVHLRPIVSIGFVTGWRKGELLSRRWCHVDLDAGWLRLEVGETKNDRGRQFPLIPRLREVLEAQLEKKREVEKRTGQIVDALFFHYGSGKPVKYFRGAWITACTKAVGRLLPPGAWRSGSGLGPLSSDPETPPQSGGPERLRSSGAIRSPSRATPSEGRHLQERSASPPEAPPQEKAWSWFLSSSNPVPVPLENNFAA